MGVRVEPRCTCGAARDACRPWIGDGGERRYLAGGRHRSGNVELGTVGFREQRKWRPEAVAKAPGEQRRLVALAVMAPHHDPGVLDRSGRKVGGLPAREFAEDSARLEELLVGIVGNGAAGTRQPRFVDGGCMPLDVRTDG